MSSPDQPDTWCYNPQGPSLGDQVYIRNDMNLRPFPNRIIIRISPNCSKVTVKNTTDNSIIEVDTKDVIVINRADIYRPAKPIGSYINEDLTPEVHDLVIYNGNVCVVKYTSTKLRYEGIVSLKNLTSGKREFRFASEELYLIYSPTRDEDSYTLLSGLTVTIQKGREHDWHNWNEPSDGDPENCRCILLPTGWPDLFVLDIEGDTVLVGFKDELMGVIPRCYLDKLPL